MPQILYLNHAAWVNAERRKPISKEQTVKLDNGKAIENATTDELIEYYKDW